MTTIFHNFDADGYYTGSCAAPISPIDGTEAEINPLVATVESPPAHDYETQRAKRNGATWMVEDIPQPEPEPEPEPLPKQNPRYYGNDKLDLFTFDEQVTVATAAMTDPMVKLTYDRLLNAAFLTIDNPETTTGLNLMVEKGLLTPERREAIIAEMTVVTP